MKKFSLLLAMLMLASLMLTACGPVRFFLRCFGVSACREHL